MAKEYVLVTVSGPDHPGITSRLMKQIEKRKVLISDMGQSVTHGLLSLSILLDVSSEGKDLSEHAILKDLLFEAKKMGLTLDFQVIEESGISKETYDSFVVSCVALESLTASFMAQLSTLLAQENINIVRIDNINKGNFKTLEIMTEVPKSCLLKKIKSQLLELSNRHQVDVAFLEDNIFRRNKRLIAFDMDSTLIQIEVIDEMAKMYGVYDDVKRITEKAMNGEIDFNESLTQRLGMLKGMDTQLLDKILEQMPLTQGAQELIETVKRLGFKVAVISGGFTYFAYHLKKKLGLDYAFANELEIENGKLTGKVKGSIINGDQKALLLELVAQKENISLEQVVAIGDGANDLPMLSKAGLGIAFHAKAIVRKEASQSLGHGPMTSVLYFLGIPGVLN